MREVKFRGQRADTKEWVYGTYHYCTGAGLMRDTVWEEGNRTVVDRPVEFNSYWILTHKTPADVGWDIRETYMGHSVIPETVGQFIGLSDKNGNEIFEGDIFVSNRLQVNEVKYINGGFRRVQVRFPYTYTPSLLNEDDIERFDIIITGNIHDHPHLIK